MHIYIHIYIRVHFDIHKYYRNTYIHIHLLKCIHINIVLQTQNDSSTKSFVVGFTGSSVTAGHGQILTYYSLFLVYLTQFGSYTCCSTATTITDNYFKDAYPQVFYDTMNPVMQKLKAVKLVVRNHALGLYFHSSTYIHLYCISMYVWMYVLGRNFRNMYSMRICTCRY